MNKVNVAGIDNSKKKNISYSKTPDCCSFRVAFPMPATQPTPRGDQPLQTSRSQPQQPPSHHTNNIDKDFDVLWSFFNINLKKKFHKTIDQLKLFAKNKCLINFLKDCICKKVVPKTFIIKHDINPNFSENNRNKLNSQLKIFKLKI